MKGILIVRHKDMLEKPELMGNLSIQSEQVLKKDGNIIFHSKNGALMTMICALLDQEVQYALQFEQKSVEK